MNHIFTFETNLNDIFTRDDIEKSERCCDYCIKRKRVCKCETIKRELGSEEGRDIEELMELKMYYDEICEKIVDKYQDVVSRFEYDKDIVKYIKGNNINDEIESEDWLYFYELLKERKIVERCIDTKESKEVISFYSFHIDEEANFLSSLNYYLKTNNYNNIYHNWMGMSINPFNEYGSSCSDGSFSLCKEGKVEEGTNIIFSDDNMTTSIVEECENDHSTLLSLLGFGEYKKVHSLYYFLYIQDNERWISGMNNTGNICHLENIDHVWNKTVRESTNRIKLFHLITANSVRSNDADYIRIKKKRKKKDLFNEKFLLESSIQIEWVLCTSQLICALGMIDIGGCFIMKLKLSFDNFLLSVFAILSICFKKLEVYKPSSCYVGNVVFLVATYFNGITSIFLSSLNNWVQSAQRDIAPLLGCGSSGGDGGIRLAKKKKFCNHSLIPRKWIKHSFFEEYKKCIKHFVDYLVFHLKKCINVSNTNLMKKNIENTKNTYISQFFQVHKIGALREREKLLNRSGENMIYCDESKLMHDQASKQTRSCANPHTNNHPSNRSNKYTNEGGIVQSSALDDVLLDKPNGMRDELESFNFFRNKNLYKIKNSLLLLIPNRMRVKESLFYENTYGGNVLCKKYTVNDNVRKYKKQISGLLKKIEYRTVEEKVEKKGLFELDNDIIAKRLFFLTDKNSFSEQQQKFEDLLKKQIYFSKKNWFKCYMHNDITNFHNPFYLDKTLFINILKCRYYIYYKNCDMHISSLRQILKQYEPFNTTYINYELYTSVIDCLFVLKNCASLDIFEDSNFLQNFLVISRESNVFDFFSKFECRGIHVLLRDPDLGAEVDAEGECPSINVEDMCRRRLPYKMFSELLINKLKKKNVCALVYIDLNTILPNYVHVVEKEIKIKNYLVASVIIAFNYLKKGGNMILRLSTVLTFFTAGIIYLLFCSFEKVKFFLPPSCDDIYLDLYIYCHNFSEYYIYRHYIQYMWDAVTCNQYVDEQLCSNRGSRCDRNFTQNMESSETNGSGSVRRRADINDDRNCNGMSNGNTNSISKDNIDNGKWTQADSMKKRKKDVYFCVPLYFLMNKEFVVLLKEFNYFYFKNHINVCLNFMKDLKYFYHNKSLIKCMLAHFFTAYVLPDVSFTNAYKSLTVNHNIFDEKKEDYTDNEEEKDESDEEDDMGKVEQINISKEQVEETYWGRVKKKRSSNVEENDTNKNNGNEQMVGNKGNGNLNFLFDLKKQEEMEAKKKFDSSSSESNYSIIYEYKSVPSEVSVSETAWESP
ncbi:conserved Plasmodium protein, unknown function [Plasmodium malariae]|uniref:Ribosomal RNA methyltransferase FtsJ domain-containing protein n=1 Tax=Plasmodium malariae TaxID=5858 RepID=A0A1C3K9P6_PLAMA|nr:conserved Plasmodium protein, unknown function [Plasmodium malariae]